MFVAKVREREVSSDAACKPRRKREPHDSSVFRTTFLSCQGVGVDPQDGARIEGSAGCAHVAAQECVQGR